MCKALREVRQALLHFGCTMRCPMYFVLHAALGIIQLFTWLNASHPQAQFPTCSSSSDPLLRWMELGYGRHGGDAVAA